MTAPARAAKPLKRIALVAPSLAGVLRDRANLIAALRARRHEVLVLAPSQLAGEIAALHALGGEHRNFEPRPPGVAFLANRRLTVALRDLMAAWRTDTVLITGSALASVAAAAARKAGAKRIVTTIAGLGLGSEDARAANASAYRRAAKVSEAVVCHNVEDARTVAATLPGVAAGAPVVTAGDGVDLKSFVPAPLPDGAQPLTFLMIACPDERAALEGYAAAAGEIGKRGLPARFRLATDREAAQDPSLLTAAGIEFLGRAADPCQLLAAADVAVHLSTDDGSPTALKQALACGRPILTLDVPGCREMVDQRVNGCLVPPGDGEALVAALESFLKHRDLLVSEGRASRAKAERCFAAETVLAPYLAALEA